MKKLKMIGESYEKRVLVTDGHSGSMNIEDGWGDALIAAQVSVFLGMCENDS